MRYTKEHKAEVHERIVRAAAASLRAHGIGGPSVPGLMKGAGLTHGGFYLHFADRDELVAEAVQSAAEETAEKVFKEAPDLAGVLDVYLSEGHMHSAQAGCVIAALGAEGSRQKSKLRTVFTRVAENLVKLVDEKLGRRPANAPVSDRALAVTAQMIGSIVLARLMADAQLARRTLRAGREAALRI